MGVTVYKNTKHFWPGMSVLVYDIVHVKTLGKYFLPDIFHDDAVLFEHFFGFFFVKPYFYICNIHIL